MNKTVSKRGDVLRIVMPCIASLLDFKSLLRVGETCRDLRRAARPSIVRTLKQKRDAAVAEVKQKREQLHNWRDAQSDPDHLQHCDSDEFGRWRIVGEGCRFVEVCRACTKELDLRHELSTSNTRFERTQHLLEWKERGSIVVMAPIQRAALDRRFMEHLAGLLDTADVVALDRTCKALREPLARPMLFIAQERVAKLQEQKKELRREWIEDLNGGHEEYECENQSGDGICDRCDDEREHRKEMQAVEDQLDSALDCVQAKLAMLERRAEDETAASVISLKRRRME